VCNPSRRVAALRELRLQARRHCVEAPQVGGNEVVADLAGGRWWGGEGEGLSEGGEGPHVRSGCKAFLGHHAAGEGRGSGETAPVEEGTPTPTRRAPCDGEPLSLEPLPIPSLPAGLRPTIERQSRSRP
jgi:hypothetical protein